MNKHVGYKRDLTIYSIWSIFVWRIVITCLYTVWTFFSSIHSTTNNLLNNKRKFKSLQTFKCFITFLYSFGSVFFCADKTCTNTHTSQSRAALIAPMVECQRFTLCFANKTLAFFQTWFANNIISVWNFQFHWPTTHKIKTSTWWRLSMGLTCCLYSFVNESRENWIGLKYSDYLKRKWNVQVWWKWVSASESVCDCVSACFVSSFHQKLLDLCDAVYFQFVRRYGDIYWDRSAKIVTVLSVYLIFFCTVNITNAKRNKRVLQLTHPQHLNSICHHMELSNYNQICEQYNRMPI